MENNQTNEFARELTLEEMDAVSGGNIVTTVVNAIADTINAILGRGAHSGDLERSFRSIMNTDSGDHEHPHEPARAGAGERCAVMLVRCH